MPLPLLPADPRSDLRGMSRAELEALVARLGERPFRARQIFRALHLRAAASIEAMGEIPSALRERLSREARISSMAIDRRDDSADGTRKYRLRAEDGALVEAVYMPDPAPPGEGRRSRRTLCLSTQVGCAMGCTFCVTGTMGFARHLGAGEMVGEVLAVCGDLRALGLPGPRPLTNLVFMGMGEPLHNFEAVKRALELFTDRDGLGFSHRHITVSTSGLVPAIERFGREVRVKLAVSLNATTDETRTAIMPVNRKWPLAALIEACRRFPLQQGRRITFEYVLLGGVNDADADAVRLARLLRRVPAKVNLIPYNDNPGLGFFAPPPERVERFRELLAGQGVACFVRANRGRDIRAACGQLAVAGEGPGDPRRRRTSVQSC